MQVATSSAFYLSQDCQAAELHNARSKTDHYQDMSLEQLEMELNRSKTVLQTLDSLHNTINNNPLKLGCSTLSHVETPPPSLPSHAVKKEPTQFALVPSAHAGNSQTGCSVYRILESRLLYVPNKPLVPNFCDGHRISSGSNNSLPAMTDLSLEELEQLLVKSRANLQNLGLSI